MVFLGRHKSIGLAITDWSASLVELGGRHGSPELMSWGRVALPSGVVVRGELQDADRFSAALTEVSARAQPRPIRFTAAAVCLPSTLVYAHDYTITRSEGTSLDAAVRAVAQEHIPLPPSDLLVVPGQVRKLSDGAQSVLVVGASRAAVAVWRTFFTRFGVSDVLFDVGALAQFRALYRTPPHAPVMIVSGHGSRALGALFTPDGLFATYPVTSPDDVATLITQVKQQHGVVVDHVVHIAESLDLTGLAVPVQMGQPWVVSSETPDAVHFVTALGAALRLFGKRWAQDPVLEVRTDSSQYLGRRFLRAINPGGDVRLRRRLFALVVLLVLGVVVVVAAYVWRRNEKKQVAEQLSVSTEQFREVQTLSLPVLVATSPEAFSDIRVPGRVLAITITAAGDYREGAANARIIAERDLSEDEVLWDVPLNEPDVPDEAEFPYTYRWLAYRRDDVRRVLTDQVDRLNSAAVPYYLGVIDENALISTADEHLLELQTMVHLSLNEFLSVPSASPESVQRSPAVEQSTATAVILDTGTGFLNVREGPGTQYSIVATVAPGDEHLLLDEVAGWYQIQVDDTLSGWVINRYVEVP